MKSAYKVFLAGLCSLFLIACGGGGSISDDGSGTPPPTSQTILVTLSIDNTKISAAEPAMIIATVKDSTGAAVSVLVTFKLNNDKYGTFVPGTGEVATNADGVATVQLNTGSIPTGATVTASISSGESASVNVTMVGDGGEAGSGGSAQVSLMLADKSGIPIQSISSLVPGKLVATVTGLTKPTIVTFDTTIGELPIKTAVTDENGIAIVDIVAGSKLGAGEAIASLSTSEVGKTIVVVGATNILMGSGAPFQDGIAEISADTLSAGGTASVAVMLQDEQGNLFSEPVDVIFTSTCVSKLIAELSSPITAVSGLATSTYLAKGCVDIDNISVSANIGGKNLTAIGIIKVLPASAGSIVFIDAVPEYIGIKGTGIDESSTLRFKVLDTNGIPVANKAVTFSLNTTIGKLAVSPSIATTNSQGVVQTVVNSGTVATTVRVTASIDGTDPLIASQSSVLVVSTGKPDQDSFSLSASTFNVEGWNYDGATVDITARLADAFNNPVPDGTAVIFTTEGGSIDDSCTTKNGVCKVVWTSQQPRSVGTDSNGPLLNAEGLQDKNPDSSLKAEMNRAGGTYYGNKYGQPYGGRVTITATAIGEESFPDLNSNNILDSKQEFDLFKATLDSKGEAINCGRDNSGDCYDLSEAFVDHNEDGIYTPNYDDTNPTDSSGNRETFTDFIDAANPTGLGIFNNADGKYSGALCDSSVVGVECSQQASISVRRSLVLVMSGSGAFATKLSDVSGVVNGKVTLAKGESTSIAFTISDINNQQMPSGTVVDFEAKGSASITSAEKYTWPSSNHNGGRPFVVSLKAADVAGGGNLLVTVTTFGDEANGIGKTITEVLNIPIVVQ
ncbi:hypothetical protein ACRN9J_04165 [Shewanella baltica]|uniref:hypothetical protein n=1 Tax=Shewanella baltica TaxID=62322 RepID=UPI00217D1735|nr:hypothetical protein [Shewanella baltica]MCS6099052.1 hypothetical protein [Shewanella baltica]MCS6181992.1 hypothetical protein [Shewanella baltica]